LIFSRSLFRTIDLPLGAIDEKKMTIGIELRDKARFQGHVDYGIPAVVEFERRTTNAG